MSLANRKVTSCTFGLTAIGFGGRVYRPAKMTLACGHTVEVAMFLSTKTKRPTPPASWDCPLCETPATRLGVVS